MSFQLLLWVYIINSIILLNHEIDSGYWQEWKLLNPKDENGINWFLILHFPMIFIVLYGVVMIDHETFTGLIISMASGLSGLFAFFFHTYHLRKGRPEFNTPISKFIIKSTLVVSVVQLIITVKLFLD